MHTSYTVYPTIHDPVIRDHGPPPQWYGGVRGRLSGPPPHHRGEGSIYSIHCIYNIHHIHNIHNKHLLLHYIHYIHHHKPPPPHHRGGGVYIQYIYIYICCIYSIYHIHNIYIKHNINIYYIYILVIYYTYIHTYIHTYIIYPMYILLYRPFTIAGGGGGGPGPLGYASYTVYPTIHTYTYACSQDHVVCKCWFVIPASMTWFQGSGGGKLKCPTFQPRNTTKAMATRIAIP